jgi:hypothetical protein
MEIGKMTLKSYADVQAFITQILTDNGQVAGTHHAPHGAFWSTSSYEDFVNGAVPNVPDPTNPTSDRPVPILVKGNSAQSNLILALRGQGPLFDPNGGLIPQMPDNGPPFFTDEQVERIADWIDAGCPEQEPG